MRLYRDCLNMEQPDDPCLTGECGLCGEDGVGLILVEPVELLGAETLLAKLARLLNGASWSAEEGAHLDLACRSADELDELFASILEWRTEEPARLSGGRGPTRQETIEYMKSQRWIDYEAGRTVLAAQQSVHPDRCQGLADAIVDAALRTEDK